LIQIFTQLILTQYALGWQYIEELLSNANVFPANTQMLTCRASNIYYLYSKKYEQN